MITDGVVTITDPVPTDAPPSGWFASVFVPRINDPRDLPFVKLSALLLGLFLPMLAVMYWPGLFRWWMAPIYWVPYLWYLGPFILMLHNTSHRTLFNKQNKRKNKIIPWVVGPLFGMSPETYFAHHLGMHHREGNLEGDLSSTMRYQRDSFLHFLRYFFRFFFLGDFEMIRYFRDRKRSKMLRRFITGELAFILVVTGLAFLNWRATLVAFIVPLCMTRLMLMMGNWAQHAFVDPKDPTNDYRTVVSFINSPYNKRCFNDGYHLGHHLKASRHWLDMPADFLAKRDEMAQQGSLVFEKIDYFMIFVLLMFKRYHFLAKFYVNLDPDKPLSRDEIAALIRSRVQRIPARA